ncbi:Inhibitor of vertebrate lysozyme (Ivy) [Polaromonas sp. OV174]|uniref:Ivy family c-type lysozyme inhibitor n=1 Tax=Polaromonas sp. OV174 TaxID=1855300 RepID=UPI0008E8BB3C|nr:Ivy family c-type lysozyme inhibitor [Polaromonas sp. OV174]SFC34547.1 Inhibitor of vertebrate lysozyme (Ivy) [Polaromonas sp. OV174]
MHAAQWRCAALTATLAALSLPALAQGRLGADVLKLYGGVYSPDCGNAKAPRLRVLDDALIVEQGNRRLIGREVMAAHSYFGNSPPPNYLVALLSQVPRGGGLMFMVYQDRAGQYIKIEPDPKVGTALGPSLTRLSYRWCNQPQSRPAPAAPSQAPVPSSHVIDPPDLLRDPAFKAAYYRALGPRVRQYWLAQLEGPAHPLSRVRIGGTEYVYAMVCKPHDCADNNTVLLYSRAQGVVYGKVLLAGQGSLIGAPPPPLAAEIERLWHKEWRQGR